MSIKHLVTKGSAQVTISYEIKLVKNKYIILRMLNVLIKSKPY